MIDEIIFAFFGVDSFFNSSLFLLIKSINRYKIPQKCIWIGFKHVQIKFCSCYPILFLFYCVQIHFIHSFLMANLPCKIFCKHSIKMFTIMLAIFLTFSQLFPIYDIMDFVNNVSVATSIWRLEHSSLKTDIQPYLNSLYQYLIVIFIIGISFHFDFLTSSLIQKRNQITDWYCFFNIINTQTFKL